MNRVFTFPRRPDVGARCVNSRPIRSFHSLKRQRPSQSVHSLPVSRLQSRQISVLRPRFRGRVWTWPDLSRHIVRHEPLLLTAILISTGLIATALYRRAKRNQLARRLGTFPPKVGLALDRAIYFTQHEPDPEKATEAFVSALRAAADLGMDPMSNEVIGIKTELATSLEKYGNLTSAVNILEDLKSSCLERMAKEDQETASKARLLSWACRISTRLADLYSKPQVRDDEKMEQCLVWAVETTLKERQRRQKQGPNQQSEGNWLDDDEIGTQLENMAHMYEERNQHFYASQLFLNALNIKPEKDCHAVILMNNLAASMAQQSPPAEPGMPPTSRTQLRESGKAWALQALALSQNIKAPDRNEECDIGCVVATHNLGEFAEMEGNIAEARERYEQAANLAHAFGFEEGITSANEGLKRVGVDYSRSPSRGFWR